MPPRGTGCADARLGPSAVRSIGWLPLGLAGRLRGAATVAPRGQGRGVLADRLRQRPRHRLAMTAESWSWVWRRRKASSSTWPVSSRMRASSAVETAEHVVRGEPAPPGRTSGAWPCGTMTVMPPAAPQRTSVVDLAPRGPASTATGSRFPPWSGQHRRRFAIVARTMARSRRFMKALRPWRIAMRGGIVDRSRRPPRPQLSVARTNGGGVRPK